MNPLLSLLAPLALLVPVPVATPVPAEAELTPRPANAPASAPASFDVAQQLDPTLEHVVEQVRIEQRVIVRIAPPGPTLRQSIVSEAMAPLDAPRLIERKIGKCVPVAGIAAVQPDADRRLLLYMRDRRLVSASLEKACRAKDFYKGFYLERSSDGMLCAERDKLQSRAGANCEISRMRQLVADDD